MAQSNTATLNLIDMVSRALKVHNRKTQSKEDKMYNPGHCMTKDEYIHYKNGLQRIGHIVWETQMELDATTYLGKKDSHHMMDFFFQHENIWVLASRADEIKKELTNIIKKSRMPEICGFCVDPGPTVAKYQDAQFEKLIKKETLYAEKAKA
jgi:hypothetical protein